MMSSIGESWKLVYEWAISKLGELGSRRCNLRSAVVTAIYCRADVAEGRSKLKAVTLKIFERLGSDCRSLGIDGAGTVHSRSASSTPSFSKFKLRSKVFFSSRIDSIVTDLSSPVPTSSGRLASLTKLVKVYLV